MVLLLVGLSLVADSLAHEMPLLLVRRGGVRDRDRVLAQLLLRSHLLSLLLMEVGIDILLHAGYYVTLQVREQFEVLLLAVARRAGLLLLGAALHVANIWVMVRCRRVHIVMLLERVEPHPLLNSAMTVSHPVLRLHH